MTIADEIREEEREKTTFSYVKGLLQNGASTELISKSFGLSIKEVEEIIKKIENTSK
ncbi:hypothetical protein VB264_11015 [Arcicella aquatica]|uniref:Transposase n=1 Tax=Arcicella aquatica TaxID=217141 RepID=A0ABU5QMM8_9BACT|nr:hypothetical protein [Arcicella aquatica]MEA5258312.1 hypothetical protein [Arcicella aquatica]